MTDLWYENPKVLFDNMDHFFPNKNLTQLQKINSLARFAIYYSILIIILQQDTKWFSISIIILLISGFLGKSEKFTTLENNQNIPKCQTSTKENPFMNYTLGDLLNNKKRPPACNFNESKELIRKNFRSHLFSDTTDIWGKFISDRNFYTMPNTDIVNDQTGFALWCFGNSGECKTTGNNCLKNRDPVYHRGRITTLKK